MSKPNTVKDFGPDALLQLEQMVLDAITASGVGGGGTPEPFLTGEESIAAPPTITQLPATPTPSGVQMRVDEDVLIFSTDAGFDGFILYEGDDIEFRNVTNLDQVYVRPIKNKTPTLYWRTL